jgi:uncharacterized protein involved in exopolysaccharide biosynthesis
VNLRDVNQLRAQLEAVTTERDTLAQQLAARTAEVEDLQRQLGSYTG